MTEINLIHERRSVPGSAAYAAAANADDGLVAAATAGPSWAEPVPAASPAATRAWSRRVDRDPTRSRRIDPPARRRSNASNNTVAAFWHSPTGDTCQLVTDVNDLINYLRNPVAAHRPVPSDTATRLLIDAADNTTATAAAGAS